MTLIGRDECAPVIRVFDVLRTCLAFHREAAACRLSGVNWLAPTFGLLGVIVGGVLNAAISSLGDRRRARAAATVAARLLGDELRVTRARVDGAISLGRWGPVLDPGLPYSSGLWAVEHRGGERQGSVWPTMRKDMAPFLQDQWRVVARPFLLIDGLSTYFWVDDPERPLSDKELAALRELSGALSEATTAVDRLVGD
jgi:hypothetical protein